MRRDLRRLILGAPGEIHLSHTVSASISHFVLQPFLNAEFLQARISVRGWRTSLCSADESLAKNRLARGFKFCAIDFGSNMVAGNCPIIERGLLSVPWGCRRVQLIKLTVAIERKAIWYTNSGRILRMATGSQAAMRGGKPGLNAPFNGASMRAESGSAYPEVDLFRAIFPEPEI